MYKRELETKKNRRLFLILSCIAAITIAVIVYLTGGTTKVYSNLMYIPIAFVSSTNGRYKGVIHALISALLLGPFMPLNRALNIPQTTSNWFIRLIIYVLIAFIIGFFSDYNKKHREFVINLLTHDTITELKNLEYLKRGNLKGNKNRTIISISVNSYDEYLRIFGYDFTNNAINRFSKLLENELSTYKNLELFKSDGMEFIIIATRDHIIDNNIEMIMKSIKNLNKVTIKVDNIPIYLETVMGVTNIKKETPILEGVRQSLISLRYAVQNDIRVKEYEVLLDVNYKNAVNIAGNFKDALANNNIKVACQHIYYSNTEEQYGCELLARWITDDGLMINPGDFIPTIENTELIKELTKFMVDKAISLLESNNNDLNVSVNFSAKDFNDESMEYLISRIIESEIKPELLEIEITEEILLMKDQVIKYLNRLNQLGISIAMDDFGSGYSSYYQIGELPLNKIKLDKSIIMHINDNKKTKSIVESLVLFCKQNDIIIVAEGVETIQIAETCKDIGIDLLQGYYYHKPTLLDI